MAQRTGKVNTGTKQLSIKVGLRRSGCSPLSFGLSAVCARLTRLRGQGLMERSDTIVTDLLDEKAHNALPLWAQRLGRSSPFSGPLSWPATPEEGLRQSVHLSDFGHRQLIASTQAQHPAASANSVATFAYNTVSTWDRVRSSLRLAPRNPSRGHR